jgi:hypothetical protein
VGALPGSRVCFSSTHYNPEVRSKGPAQKAVSLHRAPSQLDSGLFFFWTHTGRMLFPNALPGAITLITNLKLFESVLEELMERVRDGEPV